MDDSYDALDRATMATWRVSNLLGWSGIALLSAIVTHESAHELVRRFRWSAVYAGMNGRPSSSFGGTWQFYAPQYGFRAGVSIVIGLLIGTVIGLKVWRRQPVVATLTAFAYVGVSWFALETSTVIRRAVTSSGTEIGYGLPRHGLPSGVLEWGFSALALFTVIAAPLWARFMSRRRTV